ncbi:vWA domain-containing protein [Hydrogenobaculum acidophilum]
MNKFDQLDAILEREYDVEVKHSQEGWGCGYDPKYVSMVDMWAKGEIEDIPQIIRIPAGVVYNASEFLRASQEQAISDIGHEIRYILSTNLFNFRNGQREVFRAGYDPTSFVCLYAVFENIRLDKEKGFGAFEKKRLNEKLNRIKPKYPHHLYLTYIYKSFYQEQFDIPTDIKKHATDTKGYFEEALKDIQESYNILMESVWPRYRQLVEFSQDIRFIELILKELDKHSGRITTDIVGKLTPQDVAFFESIKKDNLLDKAVVEKTKAILKQIPDWMIAYAKQIVKMEMIEQDALFFREFLPKVLEAEIEHRGFLSFVIKPWEESMASGSSSKSGRSDSKNNDKDGGSSLGKDQTKAYNDIRNSVVVVSEILKRNISTLFPKEDSLFEGKYNTGKHINNVALATEIASRSGRIFQRRISGDEIPVFFSFLLDISSSMRKEDKLINAIKSLILISEVLSDLKLDFSISLFNEEYFILKDFKTPYKHVIADILNISPQKSTNLGLALEEERRHIDDFQRRTHKRGVFVLFSDGEPTKGMKKEELSSYVNLIKLEIPIVAISVGKAGESIKDIFGKNTLIVNSINNLPMAFGRIVQQQLSKFMRR